MTMKARSRASSPPGVTRARRSKSPSMPGACPFKSSKTRKVRWPRVSPGRQCASTSPATRRSSSGIEPDHDPFHSPPPAPPASFIPLGYHHRVHRVSGRARPVGKPFPGGTVRLRQLRGVFRPEYPSYMEGLFNSVMVSVGSVLLSALIGVPLGPYLYPLRVSRPVRFLGSGHVAHRPASPGGRARLFVSLQRKRHDPAPHPGGPGTGTAALLAERGVGRAARARLHDVRLLLPLHFGGAQEHRPGGHRSGPQPGRVDVVLLPGRHPSPPDAGHGGGDAPGIHDVHEFLQRALHLRRRVPLSQPEHLYVQAERRHGHGRHADRGPLRLFHRFSILDAPLRRPSAVRHEHEGNGYRPPRDQGTRERACLRAPPGSPWWSCSSCPT